MNITNRTLLASLLLAIGIGATSPGTAVASTKCDPKQEAHWSVLKSYPNLLTFEAALKGKSSGLRASDTKAYAEAVKNLANDVASSIPYGTEIILTVNATADSAGEPTSNQKLAEARAKSVYSTVRRAVNPTDVGRIHKGGITGSVLTTSGEQSRTATVTVSYCKNAPAAPKNASDRTSSGKNATCKAGQLIETSTFTFKAATPSYRDGVKPVDADVYNSAIVRAASVVDQALESKGAKELGGVYVEVTGHSSAAGRSSTNDSLATARAKTVTDALKKAMALDSIAVDQSYVTTRTIGSRMRTAIPQVTVRIQYCP